MKYNCTFHLNRSCNFDCSYCYVKHIRKDKIGHGVKTDIPALERIGKFKEIILTGGEPFIYPDFIAFIDSLSNFTDKINIVTNLSTKNVYKFADVINPEVISELSVSLHIGQRNDYDELGKKILYLRKKGFKVFLSQVMHPTLFVEYEIYYRFFKKYGIAVFPKVFEGFIGYREYPFYYSDLERKIITDYADKSEELEGKGKYNHYSRMIFNTYNWENSLCSYGFNNFIIYYNGDIARCHTFRSKLGNIYEGELNLFDSCLTCSANYCKCASEGFFGSDDEPKDSCPSCSNFLMTYAKNYFLKAKGLIWKN